MLERLRLYFITCKYLPKLRKFMLLYREEFSKASFALNPPLGPQPMGWRVPCGGQTTMICRVNYWRELWPGSSIITTNCCGRALLNDKLTFNPTNKLPPRIGNWFCFGLRLIVCCSGHHKHACQAAHLAFIQRKFLQLKYGETFWGIRKKAGLSGKNSQVGRPPLPQYGNAHVTKKIKVYFAF